MIQPNLGCSPVGGAVAKRLRGLFGAQASDGNPLHRSRESLANDLADGYITPHAAHHDYAGGTIPATAAE